MNGDTISKMLFEERAAIMEYDGGLTREEAELQAFLDMKGVEDEVERFRKVLLATKDQV